MQRSVLHQGGSCPQFAPGGFLIFVREATVYAARLNTDAWELRSAPVPIIEEVWSHALTGGAPIAFSSDGKMAYSHGTPMAANSLVMIARDGTVSPLIADLRTYASPRFAPDGKHIAMAMLRPDSTAMDIWVYDLARETLGRLTYSDADDERPVWSPDGERIAFVSLRNGIIPNMYVRNADGSGEVERFQVSKITQIPCGFTPEGNTIIYYAIGDPNGALWSLSLEEGAKPEPFLVTPFNEKHPALSPDGKWLAYTSNESGREEIYLRPFPKAAGKWQVSTSGGQHAMWSPDGTELFYEEDNDLMDVVIDLRAGAPMIGRPSTLFELPIGANETGRGYDISPDGQRFVAVKAELGGRDFGKSHLRFVFHWFNELETKIPKSKK